VTPPKAQQIWPRSSTSPSVAAKSESARSPQTARAPIQAPNDGRDRLWLQLNGLCLTDDPVGDTP
jgi:hypothetical protein